MSSGPNNALLSYLQRLEESNKDIMRCMEHLECQNSVNSTPLSSPTRRPHVSAGNQAEGGSLSSNLHTLASQGAIPRHGFTTPHLTSHITGVTANRGHLTSTWGQTQVRRSIPHKLTNTRGTGISILYNQTIMMRLSQVLKL